MAFPNVTDIVATTLESRSGKIADNVSKNNALLAQLKKKGKIRTFSGGRLIYEEISFAENGNAGWYSGYDTLSVGAQDVISAAEFSIKQLAVPVVISGLEMLQNSGKEGVIDLLESRLAVAEATMANYISDGLYGDGTGSGSKEITGLDAAVPVDPTTGTYGGINRATATNVFWRSILNDTGTAPVTTTFQAEMNETWAQLVRGANRPDLIIMDGANWAVYLATLQSIQRFTDASSANLGFPTVKYMDADVVLDGGIGGFATSATAYFLNTNYLHFRPHKDRNMVPLSPGKRSSVNQDAEVQILGWAGNLTCSGAKFQGRLVCS
jgi:hypothetical protein